MRSIERSLVLSVVAWVAACGPKPAPESADPGAATLDEALATLDAYRTRRIEPDRWESALEAIERASQADPGRADLAAYAAFVAGMIALEGGRSVEALDRFERALAGVPGWDYAEAARGQARFALGDVDG
ncbi:MAG: hypothetical protein QME96_17650, partial [Myxococcota bacterium]|nr:hypothetical protein [Myxococcota bacterium]